MFSQYVCKTLLLVFCLSGFFQPAVAAEDKLTPIIPIVQTCTACHGVDGLSVIPQNPILAGQHLYYIYVQLKDFKSGLRENAIMGPLAQGLDKKQMLLIAEYFSKKTWPQATTQQEIDTETATLAKQVINAGQCVACHLGGFEGDSRIPRSDGQHFEYLQKTLLDFKTKARNNAPSKSSLLGSFSDEELTAVARYLSTLN